MKIKIYHNQMTPNFEGLETVLRSRGCEPVLVAGDADCLLSIGVAQQYMAYVEAKSLDKPLYCWVDQWLELPKVSPDGKAVNTKLFEMGEEAYRYASKIFATNSVIARKIQKEHKIKPTIIGAPTTISAKHSVRKKQGSHYKEIYFDGIAMGLNKNIESLFIALKDTKYELHVSGDAMFQDQLLSNILRDVSLSNSGIVNRHERERLIKGAAIVIDPATDGLFNPLALDAILLGVPILVADTKENREIWGSLIPTYSNQDMTALHEEIKNFSLDNYNLEDLQEIAIKYTPAEIVKQLIEELKV